MDAIQQRLPPPPHYDLSPIRLQIIERIYRPSTVPGKPPVLDQVIEGKWQAF